MIRFFMSLAATLGFFLLVRQMHIIILSVSRFFRSDGGQGFYALWRQQNKEFSNPLYLFILSGIVFVLVLIYYYRYWKSAKSE